MTARAERKPVEADAVAHVPSPTGVRPLEHPRSRSAGSGCLRCETRVASYLRSATRVHYCAELRRRPGPTRAHTAGSPAKRDSTLILMAGAIRRSPLASFVVLAYVVSWAWAFPFVGARDVVKKGVG